MSRPNLSIVVPVFNEEAVLPALAQRLRAFADQLTPLVAEIVLVDDHSADRSPQLLKEICQKDPRFRYARLARNSGSHVAVLAGLAQARGECAVFLAADLQDPPELILPMLDLWRSGHHVVWAVREEREGVSKVDLFLSNFFYRLLNLLGEVNLPPRGSDFSLLDRRVIDALVSSAGSNPSIGGEIARLGFASAQIAYTKEKRAAGSTKWTLKKKLAAFADAFVSFSYAPLRVVPGNAVQLPGIRVCDPRGSLAPHDPNASSRLVIADCGRAGARWRADDDAGHPRRIPVANSGSSTATPDLFPGRHVGDGRRRGCRATKSGAALWDVGFASSRP